jgi:hypothetical protein
MLARLNSVARAARPPECIQPTNNPWESAPKTVLASHSPEQKITLLSTESSKTLFPRGGVHWGRMG